MAVMSSEQSPPVTRPVREVLTPPVRRLLLGMIGNALGGGLVLSLLIVYLHDVRGMSTAVAGLVLSWMAVLSLLVAPLAGMVIDRIGPRRVLMGALAGIMEAQYDVLRKNGHSPSEAFNETVEELTQSLIRLVDENGMDWMYSNCSATAQRGALDWKPRFKKAVLPVFNDLYKAVKTQSEAKRVIKVCGAPDYKKKLDAELAVMGNSEMWRAGAAVRSLRPHEKAKSSTVGVKGRGKN